MPEDEGSVAGQPTAEEPALAAEDRPQLVGKEVAQLEDGRYLIYYCFSEPAEKDRSV